MANRVGLFAAALAAAFMLTTGAAVAAPSFNAHGSVEQVYATGLTPGAQVDLVDSAGKTVASRPASSLGGALFREVQPGQGYHVRSGGQQSDALTVLDQSPAPPSTDIYNQDIPANGYGYMTMRDGTKLSYYVPPPQDISGALPTGYLPPASNPAPQPTLIEYSGYGYANPAGPTNGISIIA